MCVIRLCDNMTSTMHDDDVSDSSCYATEDEDEIRSILGPKMSIREHLEKDKVGLIIFAHLHIRLHNMLYMS